MLLIESLCDKNAHQAELRLPFELRQKSRLRTKLADCEEVGLFLPSGTILRGGNCLRANDGRVVLVVAADEELMQAQCATPFELTRAAYHLGNRHVPIELKPDHLKIEPDHVLADMLRSMHLIVNAVDESFEPESGAYGDHGGHHHGHGHDHDRGNSHQR